MATVVHFWSGSHNTARPQRRPPEPNLLTTRYPKLSVALESRYATQNV
jgi:hypothetical protein